jgi:hypothetical protein
VPRASKLLVLEADQIKIEFLLLKRRELLAKQWFIPSGGERELVVGDDVRPLLRLGQVSSTITGTSVSPNFRAARRRPWPAMIPALVSTRIGLLNPNSAMLAAIWAICASECVRGFFAQGINLSISHISMCFATACKVMEVSD